MKKAFTLVELIAVIVILAIIALISMPIITNIIADSKMESAKRSTEYIIRAAGDAYLESLSAIENGVTLTPTVAGGNTYNVLQLNLDNPPQSGTFTVDPTTYAVTVSDIVFEEFTCSGIIENVACTAN